MLYRLFFSALLLFAICLTASAQNNYKEISLPQLMQKVKEGKKDIVILDVRTKGEYHDTLSNNKHLNIGHIKGAINFPLQELNQRPEVIQQLDVYRDKEIYVICSHSYRSRTVSNMLLQKGFTNVTNVQGGMSEWFRDFDQLEPFRAAFYERSIGYSNISPGELYKKIKASEQLEFIGVATNPRFAFDSMMITFFDHFPAIKNASYYKLTDSLMILEKARAVNGKKIILFNTIGAGAGEMADWLSKKGVQGVNYLYGNTLGLYEYIVNFQSPADISRLFEPKNNIQYFTPLSFCNSASKSAQIIDLRHDTLFNKPTNGTKLTYKNIKDAINFPFYRSVDDFEKQFPDKTRQYVFSPHQGYTGSAIAKELTDKGYLIGWIIGGNERWEWYINNIGNFNCKDFLTSSNAVSKDQPVDTNMVTMITSVNWMPDWKSMLLNVVKFDKSRKKPPVSKSFNFNLDTRKLAPLSFEGNNLSASPDGYRLAYVKRKENNKGDIYLFDLRNNKEIGLVADTFNKFAPVWSPDGNKILYNRESNGRGRNATIEIMSIDITTGHIRQLTQSGTHKSYNPVWAPNGNKIVYYFEKGDNRDQIWLTDENGSFHKNLTNDTTTHNFFPSWIDANTIIYTQSPENIMTMDVNGKKRKRVEGLNSFLVKYNPIGKQAAYITQQPDSKLVLFDWKKKTTVVLLDQNSIKGLL